MSIKKTMLRLASMIYKKPIPIGTGISFIQANEIDKGDISSNDKVINSNLKYVKKYTLKNNLGHFALESIIVKQGMTYYKLKHIHTEEEFTISKKLFDLLFTD